MNIARTSKGCRLTSHFLIILYPSKSCALLYPISSSSSLSHSRPFCVLLSSTRSMISFLHFSHTATNFYAQLSCALSSQPPPALPAKGRAGEKAGGPSPPLYTKIFLIAANARSFYNNNNLNTKIFIHYISIEYNPPGLQSSHTTFFKQHNFHHTHPLYVCAIIEGGKWGSGGGV